LSRFKKLSELYIQGFDIKFIPNNIKGLHNLKILRITDDSLTSITNSIKKSKINCLLLENDKIGKLNIKQQVGIFDAISAIPNLLELSLYGNELDTLHSGLKSSNLQKLNIGKNRFKYIQPVILYLITEKKLNILEIDFPTDTIKFLKFLDRIDRRIQINFTVEKYIYSNEYDEFCKRNPCIIGFGQFMYH
jgi:Leucine-rich repeat (LRR) protein